MQDILESLQAIEERLAAMEAEHEEDPPLTPAEADLRATTGP